MYGHGLGEKKCLDQVKTDLKNAEQEPEGLKRESGSWGSYESLGTHEGVGIGKMGLAVCFGDTGRALIRFQPTLTED